MPRIELIPPDFDFDSGDGTPTIDVCASCAGDFEEGETYISKEHGKCEVGSTEVVHPPFDECDYECEECGDPLIGSDD